MRIQSNLAIRSFLVALKLFLKMPNVPYPYEVNGKLVTGNGSLIPISSLSNCSLLPSLTVLSKINFIIHALFRFDPTMFTQMMAAGAVAGNTGGKVLYTSK